MTFSTDKNTYTVNFRTERRVTSFKNHQPVWEDLPRWDITLDGEIVQWCYDEDQIASRINFFENGDGIDPIYFNGVTAG